MEGSTVAQKPKKFIQSLYAACEAGNLAAVTKLWLWNSTRLENEDKVNLLHSACMFGYMDIFTFLLEKGIAINTPDPYNGNNVLHTAAYNGHTELAELIFNKDKILLNMKNDVGNTPLHLAVLRGHYETVLLLGRKGARINEYDKGGVSPLHWAAFHGHATIAILLAGMGGNANIKDVGAATPLHWAACRGNDTTVKALVDMGADIDQRDENGATALHEVKSPNTAKLLLQLGAKVDIGDADGQTPLHIAAASEGSEALIEILATKANLNAKDSQGRTPLHVAVASGHARLVELLLKMKVNLDIEQLDGATPGLVALQKGYVDIAKMLVAAGADRSFFSRASVCLIHAIEAHNMEVLGWLRANGADLRESKNERQESALAYAISNNRLVLQELLREDHRLVMDWVDDAGNRPLHLAAKNGKERTVMVLIDMGAEVNARNKQGKTPLMMAARNCSEWTYFECADALINSGAVVDDCDSDGVTALMEAISAGSLELVSMLLKRGAKVSTRSRSTFPLLLASELDSEEMAKLLVRHGAKINKVHGDGSPLHRAVEKGTVRVVEYLLSVGAEINIRNWDGTTPIWHAAKHGHMEIAEMLLDKGARMSYNDSGISTLTVALNSENKGMVRLLLENGADASERTKTGETLLLSGVGSWDHEMMDVFLNGGGRNIIEVPNERGQTPLSLACRFGKTTIVEVLLAHGANVKVKDKDGKTPMDIAASRYHKDIMQMLVASGSEPVALVEICTICLEECNDPVKLDPCNHLFCRQCVIALESQKQKKCPNCRKLFQKYFEMKAVEER